MAKGQGQEWSENLLAIPKEGKQMSERKRLTRRSFLRLSAAAVTGAVMAACTPATPVVIEKEKVVTVEKEVEKVVTVEKEVEKVVTATPIPLTGPVTVRYTHVADPGELEVRQTCIAEFEERNADIKVVAELVPEDGMAQKITTMVAGGAAPDLVYVHPSFVPLFGSAKVLVSLDDIADSDPQFAPEDFFEMVVGHFEWGGNTYGYPYYSGPVQTYFNKTLFDEAGVEYPTEYMAGFQDDSDKWTREKQLELALKMTKGEGAERIFGLWPIWMSLHAFNHVIWSFGGRCWNEDQTECLLTEPEAMEAIKFQADLYMKHNVAPLPQQAQGLVNGFLSGRVAMLNSVKSGVPGMRDMAGELGIELGHAPLPQGPGGRFSRDGPNATGILSTSKFKEASWEFVKYMAGPKPGDPGGSRFEFEMNRALPCRKSLYGIPAFVDNLLPWEDAAVYARSSECVRAYSYPLPARYSEINRSFRSHWDAILTETMTVDEAMQECCAEINQFLAG
jgi:multiple sugar transport system substrate-binding protein